MKADLPESWSWVPLSDLGTWHGGGTPSKASRAFWEGGTIPWVSPKDMKVPKIRDSEDHITPEAVESSAVSLIPAGAVLLVTRSGILRHTLPVATTEIVVTINQDLKALTPHPGIRADYVAYALQAFEAAILSKASKGGTTVQSIESAKLQRFEIPLAPTAEQARIVEEIDKQLTRLDAAIMSLRHAQEALKTHRASVLKAAYEGRLVPTEKELGEGNNSHSKICSQTAAEVSNKDLPTLAEGWRWTKIASLARSHRGSICAGPFGTIFKAKDFRPTGVPIIFLRHVKPGTYLTNAPTFMDAAKWRELFQPYSVQGGELLITKLGEPPGVAAIYPLGQGPAMLTPDVMKLEPNESLVLSRFIMYYLNSPVARRFAFGAAFGTTRLRLTLPIFRNIPVPLPSIEEQLRIVSELERALSVEKSLEACLNIDFIRSAALRRSILLAAFSGKLSDKSSNDEPVTILLERIRQNLEANADARPHRELRLRPGTSPQDPGARPIGEPQKGGGNTGQLATISSRLEVDLDVPFLKLGPDMHVKEIQRDSDFLSCSRDVQTGMVWEALLGHGPLHKKEAIRKAAQGLRGRGLTSFQRLRQGGILWKTIATAIDRGIRESSFDRPRRGSIRALLPDAREYSPKIWLHCLLESLNGVVVEEEQALRGAADWARENLGLVFTRLRTDGFILQGLSVAAQEALKEGRIELRNGKIERGEI